MHLVTTSVRTKVALLIVAAILAMLVLALVLVIESRDRINSFHVESARTALNASLAMLEQDNALVTAGEVTIEQAQQNALARLRTFRYDDGEGYVAITDDVGFMVMHPVHEHLDQQNIWSLQDATGRYIVQEILETTQEQGSSVHTYFFENPVTGELDVKTSAVGRFAHWGWTLIVGVFEQSVDEAVNDMLQRALFIVALMSFLFLALAIAIARSLSKPISALTGSMTAIANGDLNAPIPHQNLNNECGRMARALAVFRDSGRKILELQAEKETAQRAIEAERRAVTARLRDQFGEVLDAATRGDFTRRIATNLPDENLRALANTLNTFVETVDAGVTTVRDAMSSMSKGEPPGARIADFEGAFADMLEHVGVTAEKIQQQAQHLEYAALHDPLTGLPNRRYFEQRLGRACGDDGRLSDIALLHIDLDRFKEINDTLGHAAGDEVLKHTARSLIQTVRTTDFIARVGGDEFVVVCEDGQSDQTVGAIAGEIVENLRRPYRLEDGVARFGASVGVARATVGDKSPEDLLTKADLALYEAKKNGRGQVCFFTKSLETNHLERKRVGDDILRALECGEFVPFFQPQVDAKTRALIGVEALARWRHPKRGFLAPHHFLSVAEEIGVVGRIDAQIFDASVAAIARINGSGVGEIEKLSVNVSFNRLMDADLLSSIDQAGPLEHRLAFELLESIVFDDQEDQFALQIDAIKDRGVEVEIDDFGTGRASITGLLKVGPNRLKVDRQLVAPIVNSEPQRRLMESIIEIGRSLEIGIIAEGVETMQHAELLTSMRCETLQGYAFAPPLAEPDLIDFMRQAESRIAS